MAEEENKNDMANEPLSQLYKNITVHSFKSFEEMNEYDAKEVAKFTSLEHLQHATEVIKHIHAEELKNEMKDLTIHFKQPWK